MAKKKTGLTATKLRALLATCLVLIFGLTAAGFIYGRSQIASYSKDVTTKSTEAEASRSRVQDLQATEIELEKHSLIRERAEQIVAESKSYQYQDQIIRDINSYADKAGVAVTGFSFSSGGSEGGATAPAPAPAAETPATPEAGMEGAGGAAPVASPAASLKSTKVTVSLGSDPSYSNLLRFMTMIEQNLTKMQIDNVSLTRSSEGGADSISAQSLNLEVYIR